MSRADTIAMRDGGETLHMNTQETGERGGFDLADLWKALGDVGHRAVMLTELLTGR